MTTGSTVADLGQVDSIARLSVISLHAGRTAKGAGVWWRGHSDSSWNLRPGIFRGKTLPPDREKNLALRFMAKAATRHGKCPDQTDLAGWLFLMQHYGLPTRLLDWSESILVAAYFASSENQQVDGTIWGLLPYHLNLSQIGSAVVPLPAFREVTTLVEAALGRNTINGDKTIAVLPLEADLRMLLQHGAYTIHSSATPLESYQLPVQSVFRATIPAKSKPALVEELQYIGIRRSTLFPDLHNLAMDVRDAD